MIKRIKGKLIKGIDLRNARLEAIVMCKQLSCIILQLLRGKDRIYVIQVTKIQWSKGILMLKYLKDNCYWIRGLA